MNILNYASFDTTIFYEFVYFIKNKYSVELQNKNSKDMLIEFFDKYYINAKNESDLQKTIYLIQWIMPNWLHFIKNQHQVKKDDYVIDLISAPIDTFMYQGSSLKNSVYSLNEWYESILFKMVNQIMISNVNTILGYTEFKLEKEKENGTKVQ